MMNPIVKVDQVWEDNDSRLVGTRRRIKVIMIEGNVVTCENTITARHTKIKLSRFRPTGTGYKLIEE